MARTELSSTAAAGVPPPDTTPPPRALRPRAWFDLLRVAWRTLLHPWATVLPTGLLLILGIAGLLLPQLPGQLLHEPASAARWLESTALGPFSEVWRTLGLYTVAAHPLLLPLLAWLCLVFSARLAANLRTAWALRRRQAQATSPAHPPQTATAEQFSEFDLRRQRLIAFPPAQVAEEMTTALDGLQGFQRIDLEARDDHGAPVADREVRFVRIRRPWLAWLPVGATAALSLAAACLCFIFFSGWHIGAPLLTQGAVYYSAAHRLGIEYGVADDSLDAPVGRAVRGAFTFTTPDQGATVVAPDELPTRWGSYLIRKERAAPGLLLTVIEGPAGLSRLGGAGSSPSLGVMLPTAGSDETVLLPELAAALRIVAQAGGRGQWAVEYYAAGDLQPRTRWEFGAATAPTISIPDSSVRISIAPAEGIQLRIEYAPGLEVAQATLMLALIFSLACLWRPTLILIRLIPWHGQTLLVFQALGARALAADLQARLLTERLGAPPGENNV